MSSVIINDMKKVVKRTVDTMIPCDYEIAIVIEEDDGKVGPTLQASNLETYPKKSIIIPIEYTDHEVETDDGTIKINNHLKKNDKVLLLRKSGGQQYVVLGRVK